MAIKRFFADKDTTITDAFGSNLRTRGTGSNMGASDILEVFSIYAQASLSSSESSRILMQFPVSTIISDRNAALIPTSGNVNFYFKLTNAEHPFTVPRNFTLLVQPLSRSFEEGNGLDMETYLDITKDQQGANWINAGEGVQWTTQGGDFLSSPSFSQVFEKGHEDLEIDITSLVEEWVSGTIPNNGLIIKLSGSQETGSVSYYTKRFFGKGSEFFFRRPVIEARWNSSIKDDRGKFVLSSSLLTAAENLNTIFLYNVYGGTYRNIPSVGVGPIFVNFFASSSGGTAINPSPITGGHVSTGIYSASVALTTAEELIFDRWFSGSSAFHTGVIAPISHNASNLTPTTFAYISNITNLKNFYNPEETGRFRLFSRLKNWKPSIFTVATTDIENNIIEDAYFKIIRITDNEEIIPYGTGSDQETLMSYDVSGNYFDLSMDLLEPSYVYGIKILFRFGDFYEEQPYTFKFRVEKNI